MKQLKFLLVLVPILLAFTSISFADSDVENSVAFHVDIEDQHFQAKIDVIDDFVFSDLETQESVITIFFVSSSGVTPGIPFTRNTTFRREARGPPGEGQLKKSEINKLSIEEEPTKI